MTSAEQGRLPVSLRVALTRRLAFVLAIIGVVGAIAAYTLGAKYANLAYDRAQADDVATLADQVFAENGNIRVNLPAPALKWLLADEGDQVIYRVTDLRHRKLIVSNGDLGPLPEIPDGTNQTVFRDLESGDRHLRVAYMRHLADPIDAPVLIEIAETTGKRDSMTEGILAGTVLFMTVMIAVAVGLVWQGVGSGLSPLTSLEAEAAKRSGTDLTPLDPLHAPIEVRGLIDAINRMMARVSRVMDSQGRFIANAAHQLRTPLAGLRLQAQLGLKAKTLDAMRAHFAELEGSAVRAGRLVEQLLTLAQAESAAPVGEEHPVDLDIVVREVIERCLPLADQYGVDLGCTGSGMARWVTGSEVLFAELIGNLVDNALRHGRRCGRVTVEIREDVDDIVVAVSDDGPGLPEANLDLLFTRFYRPDSSARGGSGLGLAIVHEIAERYRARVALQSSPVDGTCFQVYFPRARA